MSTLLKFKDGREFTEVPSEWLDVVNMVGAQTLTNDPVMIERLKDAPYKIGDCILDCWQGVYWLCRQSKLLKETPVTKYHWDGPAIAIGSGPSLDLYIDVIRAWKGRALITCAHSTANRLLSYGIVPDIVTPVERVNVNIGTHNSNKVFIDQIPMPGAIFGGLPLVPNEYRRYGSRMLTCSKDPVFTWAGCQEAQIFTSATSGGAAVAVAAQIATGPIYLVGLDIVGNHCRGYDLNEDPLDNDIQMSCNDGIQRLGNAIKFRSCHEISLILANKTAYQCAYEGAVIKGVPFAELPDATGDKKCLRADPDDGLPRFRKFQALKRGLSLQLTNSVDKCLKITKASDLHCGNLFDPDYVLLGICLFRSLFAQISMEIRFGMPEAQAMDWCKEAYRSVIEGIIGGADELRR